MHKFWMVQGAGPAHARHKTLADARIEASRLARKHPSKEFVVMEAVSSFVKSDVIERELTEDPEVEIPF